jgi:peptidoglycan/LPS O-acetylase OafA/YrhL
MIRDRIEAITGLRGFAALLVVYAHFAEKSWQLPDPHFPGEVGVMIFFSLSGFLISYLYLDKQFSRSHIIDYIVARVARIAPAYLVIVLASFIIYNCFNPEFVYAISSHNIARHLFFSGNVSVFWSIAPEVQFYAIFLLIWAMKERVVNHNSIAGMLMLGLLFVVLMVNRDVFPGTFVGAKLHYFLFGVIAGQLRTHIGGERQDAIALSVLQALMIALMIGVELGWIAFPYLFKVDFYTSIPTALLSALFVFSFSLPSPVAKWLFENRFMKRCGEWSFSIYLLNMPIIYLFRPHSHQWLDYVASSIAGFIAILLASWANFQIIEKRGARYIRAVGKRLEQFWLPATPQLADARVPVISNSLEGL